jgi:hypothetical protein
MYLYLLVIVFALLVVIRLTQQPSIVWTCTTFFDFPKEDKYAVFHRGLTSLLSLHTNDTLSKISKWVVINEYADPENRKGVDWADKIRNDFPFVSFIQKGSADRGHCRSINTLLGITQGYTYNIWWEEAWFATEPFLDSAIAVMNTTQITQLQFTRTADGVDGTDYPEKNCTSEYCIIPKTFVVREPNILEIEKDKLPFLGNNWPLFSLRPSINRICDRPNGYFSYNYTNTMYPEYEYAYRWYTSPRTIKAYLVHGPVTRADKHVHTWD